MKSKNETRKIEEHNYGIIFFGIMIFCSIINQGAYFAIGLFALIIMFVLYMFVKKEYVRFDLIGISFLGIVIIAILSGMVFSIDKYIATIELSKYVLLFLSYIFYINQKNKKKIEDILFAGIVFIMIFGLLGYLQVGFLKQMVMSEVGRLQSFLQYANTTALFMGIGVFMSVDRYIKEKKKRYIVFGCLFILALVLTKSRTTLVLFVLIFSAYMLYILKGKYKIFFGISLLIFIAILLLFGGRIVRISLTEPTFIERIITYQDGAKMLFKSFFGLGMGNWQFMQFSNQSAPYQVRYIHNGFLQIGIDCGIIALLIFVGVAVYCLYKNYKCRNVYYYIALLMLVHMFFEVDLNFGIVIVFYTFVLSCINSDNTIKEYEVKQNKIFLWIFRSVGSLLVIALICLSYADNLTSRGDKLAKTASETAKIVYSRARRLNPMDTALLFKLAQVDRNPQSAIYYLEETLKKNPYNFEALISLSEGYRYKKDYSNAVACAEKLFNIFPYNKKHQSLLVATINEAYQAGKLTEEEYTRMNTKITEDIRLKNDSINILYKYIDKNMDY